MLAAWQEWKERCALDLCSVDAQKALHGFARTRFARWRERCPTAEDSPTHENPWHLFETYATATATKQGKRYKDWIFARVGGAADNPLNVVQGGATLIMRDAVREFIRTECSPRCTLSLDRPLGNADGGAVSLLDLLPAQIDPVSEICLHEYENLAGKHAREFVADMSNRERVAVVARQVGLSLSHRAVERAAGCKKSMLAVAYRDVMTRIAARLKADYPDDDNESVLTLALMTIGALAAVLAEHRPLDGPHARLFALAGERCRELAEA